MITAVLSFSRLASDQRVQRQARLLQSMGLEPVMIGYALPADTIALPMLPLPPPQPTTGHRLSTLLRQVPAWGGAMLATAGFWAAKRHRAALTLLEKRSPTLIIANDWPAAMVAIRYADKRPVPVVFDIHEFATEEFADSRWWRLVYQPFVRHIEAQAIVRASVITTVGHQLGDELQRLYQLPQAPTVIRSVSDRSAAAKSHEPGWPLTLLYHGHIMPGRGLEATIDSMKAWRHPHRLLLRGNGAKSYIAALIARAETSGIANRLTHVPAVAPTDVVKAASDADMGLYFGPLDTVQQRVALPNKVFEYIAAGLALAVSPAPDMAKLVHDHKLGIVSRNADADAISDLVNALTREAVAAMRRNSAEAARHLCWEVEGEKLRTIISSLLKKS